MTEPTLPATIRYSMQPYTNDATIGKLRWATDHEGRRILVGEVLAGTERSFLFGRSAARDIAGRPLVIYGVTPPEIESGHIIRVAM